MKGEVWWAKWKLFYLEIYAFWTISTVSKQVGRGRAWSHFKWNTHSHADISDKALWSASNQTDCKYFETITSSEFISSTQVCFKRHSAKCLYVANVQSPLQEFQLERKYSQSEYNHFGSCQFWPTSNFVSATRICHSKLQLFCASCEGLADWTFSSYRANWTWQ